MKVRLFFILLTTAMVTISCGMKAPIPSALLTIL